MRAPRPGVGPGLGSSWGLEQGSQGRSGRMSKVGHIAQLPPPPRTSSQSQGPGAGGEQLSGPEGGVGAGVRGMASEGWFL